MSHIGGFLHGIGSHVFGYFYHPCLQEKVGSSDENSPLLEMEAGQGTYASSFPKSDPEGTIKMSTQPIIASEQTKMIAPEQPPGAAAGDAKKFIPRQEFLLRDQYEDKKGATITTIGTVIYDILGKAEPKEGLASIIDIKTATDIGLIADKKAVTESSSLSEGKTIASAIDRTKTKIGGAYLRLSLARPSADLDVVLERQKIINTLTQDADFHNELDSALESMATGEVQLLSCWDGRMQLPGSANSLYYKMHPKLNDILNNSALALDLSAIGTTTKKVTGTVMQAASGIALSAYALTETARAIAGTSTPEMLENYADRFTASTPVGVLGGLAMEAHVPAINAVVGALAGIYSVMSLQSTYDWMKVDTAMLPLMRKILSSIATYYKGMKAIHAALQKHPEMAEKLKHFKKLDAFIRNAQESPELQTLLNTLESFSFNPDNNYLFRPGEALLAWELLHSGGSKKAKKGKGEMPAEKTPPTAGDIIRAAFEEALPAIGEIDALLSSSKLIKESETDKVKFCFPEFILGSDRPALQLEGVWNPMISREKAIVNDIALGKGAPSNGAILTGPNAGGKSSLTKAMVAAVALAHYGICPAKKATLTPFNYVRTSMNIQDSIESEHSLFASQCQLVGNVVSGVKQLSGKTFSLTVLDELFTQTNDKQGSALAMGAARELSLVAGNINILVTHFRNVPEEIGDKPREDGILPYKNYRMEGGGAFTLAEGISQEANAFDVAEKFGVGEGIVQDAKDHLG